jgi:hypothetical protein
MRDNVAMQADLGALQSGTKRQFSATATTERRQQTEQQQKVAEDQRVWEVFVLEKLYSPDPVPGRHFR